MVKVRFNDQPIQIRVQGAALVTHQSALAQAAASLAQDAADFAEGFTGPVFASVEDGEAATTEGQIFRVSNGDGPPETTTAYRRTSGGSVVQAPLATTAALASPDGAEMVVTPAGTVQSLLDSFGWFSPDARTASLAREFQTLRQSIVPGPGADNTDAIQAWEDAVTAYAAGGATIQTPSLVFGPHVTCFGPMLKKSFSWEGAGEDNTVLRYTGTAGADWITQDTVTGRNSAGRISGLTLDGQNCRTIYTVPLNGAGFGADDRLRLDGVRLINGDNHIHYKGWVNGKVTDARHDNWHAGYAVIFEPKVGQNLSHFEYNCTLDTNSNGQTTNSPLGVFKVDLTNIATSGNIGILKFSGKRWEVNHAPLGGNKAFIDIYTNAGAFRQATIVVEDVPMQCSVSGGVNSLCHRSASGTLNGERYMLRNIQMDGIGAIFTGDYPDWMKAIPAGNWLHLEGDPQNGFVGIRTSSSGATGVEVFGPATNTVLRQVKPPALANATYIERPDVLFGGSGAVTPRVRVRFNPPTTWAAPPANILRALSDYVAPTISDPPTQAEVQAIANALQAVTRFANGIVTDLRVGGPNAGIFGDGNG